MTDWKKLITDILAYVVGIGTVIQGVITGLPDGAEWYAVALQIMIAVGLWFTGRNADGSKKKVPTKV
jgi:hypothetical protein